MVLVAGVTIAALAMWHLYHAETQLALSRFFRDVSRAKAHRRLHNDANALMSVLAGTEELLPISEPDESTAVFFSEEELSHFDGQGGAPIYLAIMGRVYDVSEGRAFYAPLRSYHHYTGKDATRAFATGCNRPECLVPSLVGVSEGQRQEALRWLELYEHHDRYRFVGLVRANPADDLAERAVLEEAALNAAAEAERHFLDGSDGRPSYAAMHAKAKRLYVEGRFDDAVSYWKAALASLGEATEVADEARALQRADILVTMAALAQKRGNLDEAQESYREAIEGLTENLGAEGARAQPVFARALSDGAAAAYVGGDSPAAAAGFRQALAAYDAAIAAGADTVGAERANTQLNLALVLEPGPEATAMLDELAAMENVGQDPKLDRIKAQATAERKHGK